MTAGELVVVFQLASEDKRHETIVVGDLFFATSAYAGIFRQGSATSGTDAVNEPDRVCRVAVGDIVP